MARLKLTAEAVFAVSPGKSDIYLYDEQVRGFGVRITPHGTRIAFVQRRVDGKGIKKKVGDLGDTLSVKQAREKARLMLPQLGATPEALLADNYSPLDRPFVSVVDDWLEQHVRVKLKPTTQVDYEQIARTLKARFPSHTVRRVTKDDCRKLHADMAKTPRRANYVLTVLGSILAFGELFPSPTRGIPRYREKLTERILSSSEMAAAFVAINQAQHEGLLGIWACQALRFAILTGARPSEVKAMKWADLDYERKRVVLPDSKANRIRIIYTNEAAWGILTSTPKLGEYVFAGATKDAPYRNLTRAWGKVRAIAKLEGVRLYDVRHTFASEAALAGHNLPMIGALLGHTVAATTQRYVHLVNDPAAAASQDVGDRMAAALAAAAGAAGATQIVKVVRRATK